MFEYEKNFDSLEQLNDRLQDNSGTTLTDHLSGTFRHKVAQTKDFVVYALVNFGTPALMYKKAFEVKYMMDGEEMRQSFYSENEVEEFVKELYERKAKAKAS